MGSSNWQEDGEGFETLSDFLDRVQNGKYKRMCQAVRKEKAQGGLVALTVARSQGKTDEGDWVTPMPSPTHAIQGYFNGLTEAQEAAHYAFHGSNASSLC